MSCPYLPYLPLINLLLGSLSALLSGLSARLSDKLPSEMEIHLNLPLFRWFAMKKWLKLWFSRKKKEEKRNKKWSTLLQEKKHFHLPEFPKLFSVLKGRPTLIWSISNHNQEVVTKKSLNKFISLQPKKIFSKLTTTTKTIKVVFTQKETEDRAMMFTVSQQTKAQQSTLVIKKIIMMT